MDSPEPNWQDMLRSVLGDEVAEQIIASLEEAGMDPAQFASAGQIPSNPAQFQAMMSSLRGLLDNSSGPVNWQTAWDIARQVAHGGDDPILTAAQAAEVTRALSVADLWLDSVTELNPAPAHRKAWSRVEWVDATAPIWKQICTPVAENATRALASAIEDRFADDDQTPELGGLMAGLDPSQLMSRLASGVFTTQIGQVVGKIATEALGSTDVSLPLQTEPVTALVVNNVNKFGQDLNVPADQVLAYLAVREAAHARLFGSVPWLRAHVLTAVENYSREIALDFDAIAQATQQIQSLDPTQIQKMTTQGIFSSTPTPAQAKALSDLEVTLAVIEGWIEVVTFQACAPHVPQIMALQEMMRRRRATGSASEQMLGSLIGLQLRPRRARDAAKLWEQVGRAWGIAERDRLWAHPDVMPKSQELDDPDNFITLRAAQADLESQVDLELEKLLEGTLGWAEGLEPGGEKAKAPESEPQSTISGERISGPFDTPARDKNTDEEGPGGQSASDPENPDSEGNSNAK